LQHNLIYSTVTTVWRIKTFAYSRFSDFKVV